MTTETNNNVKLVNIETELSRQKCSPDGSDKQRACLFNFIIYAKEKRRIEYLQKIVQTVIEKFPCRILFIHGDSDPNAEYLETSVSTVVGGKEGVTLLCDQIVISAAGKHLSRVPFLVIPHIVPDLPVCLLWGQDPTTDNEILPRLDKFANRVIFDSETACDLSRFSTQLLEYLSVPRRDVVDLNWARLVNWRNLFTQIFCTPEHLEHLAHANHIEIKYQDLKTEFFEHNDIQAIYLQGWLSAQLGWSFVRMERKEGSAKFIYSLEGKEIIIDIIAAEYPDLLPGSLLSIEITSHDNNHYLLRREAKQQLIRVEITHQDICELPLNIPSSNLNRGLQFLKEIFYEPTSTHYYNMLQAIAKIK